MEAGAGTPAVPLEPLVPPEGLAVPLEPALPCELPPLCDPPPCPSPPEDSEELGEELPDEFVAQPADRRSAPASAADTMPRIRPGCVRSRLALMDPFPLW